MTTRFTPGPSGVVRPVFWAAAAALAGASLAVADANRPNAFIGPATGSLTDPANWSLGVVPGVADDAVFPFGTTAGMRTLPAANLTVGSLNLLNTSGDVTIYNPTASTTSALTLGGVGSGGNGLSADPLDLINVPSTASSLMLGTFQTGVGATTVTLGQSGRFFLNSGTSNPALTVYAPLALGSNTLTFDGTGAKSLNGGVSGGGGIIVAGRGEVWVSGSTANTFSGGITVRNGATLRPLVATGLGTGPLTLDDGAILRGAFSNVAISTGNAITVGGRLTYANSTAMLDLGTGPATLNANARFTIGDGTLAFRGAIGDGGAGYGLTKTGNGTLSLQAKATYGGATTVSAGTLSLEPSASGAAANNLLPTATALTLGGGTLTLRGASGATNGQTLSSTILARGGSTVSATSGTGGTANVALGGLTRQAGGTVNFLPPTSGGITTTTANAAGGILGGWATINRTDWAASAASAGSPGAISALAAYTPASATPANNAGANIDVSASLTATGPISPRTIRISASGISTLTLTGTNVISTGGILFAQSTTFPNDSTITGGTLTSGSGELILHNYRTATINSDIADNGPTPLTLVHAGFNGVTFNGKLSHTGGVVVNGGSPTFNGNNTYTGQTVITSNAFTTYVGHANGLGAAGVGNETVVQDGGSVTAAASATINERFIVAGSGRGNGAIRVNPNLSPTFAGDVLLAESTLVGFLSGSSSARTTVFSGVIREAVAGARSDLQFTRGNGASDKLDQFVLTNANTYGGNTYVTDTFAGSTTPFGLGLQGGDDRLPATTVLYLGGQMPTVNGVTAGGSSPSAGSGRLMMGANTTPVRQTIAGLVSGGTTFNFNAVLGGAALASTLTINSAADHVYTGALGNGGVLTVANGDNLALVKLGSGKQTLGGVGTFNGGTVVRGGTLVANGGAVGTNYGLGSGAVTVDSTGVLAGVGNVTSATTTVGGTTATTAGGTITSGTGTTSRDLSGTLSTGNLVLNGRVTTGGGTLPGGKYVVKFTRNTAGATAPGGGSLAGGTAGTWDTLSVGTLDLSNLSAASPFTLSLVQVAGGAFDATASRAFKIIGATGIVLAGGVPITADADVTNRFVLDTVALNLADYKFSVTADYVSNGSADLVLNFDPQSAPEPGTTLLAGLAASAVLGRRRGRRTA